MLRVCFNKLAHFLTYLLTSIMYYSNGMAVQLGR